MRGLEYETVVMTKLDRRDCQSDLAGRIQLSDGDRAEALLESGTESLRPVFESGGSLLEVAVDFEYAMVRGQAPWKDSLTFGAIQIYDPAQRHADGEGTGNDGPRAGPDDQVEGSSNIQCCDASLFFEGVCEALQVGCGIQSPHSATIEAENPERHGLPTSVPPGRITDAASDSCPAQRAMYDNHTTTDYCVLTRVRFSAIIVM